MAYVTDHWHGAHGIGWSLWFNLIALRIVVFALHDWLSPTGDADYSENRYVVLALAFAFHGVLFVWQVVGVLRASEIHLQSSGSMAPVWGTYVASFVAVFWVLTYVLGAWQMTLPIPDLMQELAEFEAARAAKYEVVASSDGQTLMVSGSLELGISRAFERRLSDHPQAYQVILSSPGGSIHEARGLAYQLRRSGLDTYVVNECSSACTIAFAGGAKREAAPGARFGFHQYRIDADYAVLAVDPLREQARDQALLREAGVAAWFVDRIFESLPSEMWFPDLDELLRSGFLTQVVATERLDNP